METKKVLGISVVTTNENTYSQEKIQNDYRL